MSVTTGRTQTLHPDIAKSSWLPPRESELRFEWNNNGFPYIVGSTGVAP